MDGLEPTTPIGPAQVPVFVLCGGLGTRLGSATATIPKPMIDIGEHPLLVHIMRWYGRFGFRRFVLCTGYRGEVISGYFLNFPAVSSDYTIDLGERSVSYHQRGPATNWQVTVAYTGANAQTGARLARAAASYLGDAPHLAVTYGDGLTDADLGAELEFHLGHDRLATVLGVRPPSRFGHLELHEDGAADFIEKPTHCEGWINGGFFLFRRGFLDYLTMADDCVLERGPLERLGLAGQLAVFPHQGWWSCCDTPRDHTELQGLWEAGTAPWRC